ncbi:MAG: alpha/beta hydrolase [Ruminococcus sp.]|nr:alpha/beta hydrolase [Ruminococcus sp.]
MLVHEFVDGHKPVMVLVHGVLTPWQVWTPQIDSFRAQYNIFAIALNAHTEETASEFVSVLDETEEIIQYFENNGIVTIDVLCGLSLGGKIAHEIWKSGRISVRNLIMDGAPLAACPKFAINIMIKNYKNIINKSRQRDAKLFRKFDSFLPEKYLNSYLKIADLFTDRSVENIVNSVFAGGKIIGIDNQCRILFIHGTKANEVLSKYSAKLIKRCYPDAEVVCFRGDAHCYKAIFQPEKWIEVVKGFLENQ